MLARRRCGCSSHRPLAPVPLFLQSQRHSTALPSAKRYDNRYGAKWKSNFRECPKGEVRAPLVTMPQACPIGRLPLMSEEGRPTGLQYEDVVKAATSSGTVEFEGRQVRVVG